MAYAAGGSKTSYAFSATGWQNAMNAAATAQDSSPPSSCVPWFIEITENSNLDLAGGQVSIPAKNCNQYIHNRTAAYANLPPEGTRIDPVAHSAYLVKVISTITQGTFTPSMINMSSSISGTTRYWSFEGIEFFGNVGRAAGDTVYGTLLQFGETSASHPISNDQNLRPDHLEIRHCYFHGVVGASNVLLAIGVGANFIRVLDSYIDAIAAAGTEAKGFLASYTDGNIQLRNNYISAATENTFIGGSFSPAGMLPTNIEFSGNRYFKAGYYKFGTGAGVPTSDCFEDNTWLDTNTGIYWECDAFNTWQNKGTNQVRGPAEVKNLWEMKMGRGVKVFGNDLARMWVPGQQNGETFVLNLVTQATGSNPLWVFPNNVGSQSWTTTEDFLIAYNNIHDGQTGVTLGYEASSIEAPCAQANPPNPCFARAHNNIQFIHNLLTNMMSAQGYDFSGSPEGNGSLGGVANQGDYNIVVSHNSFLVSTFSSAAISGQLHNIATSNRWLN